MFNLGYLPGADKTRITRPETTLAALTQALESADAELQRAAAGALAACGGGAVAAVPALTRALASPAPAAGPKGKMTNPDFTKGDPIPEGANHDWNLGATGARGWMFSDRMVTSDARQIRVTKVEPGSPADGTLAFGDVILGVDDEPFDDETETPFVRCPFFLAQYLPGTWISH